VNFGFVFWCNVDFCIGSDFVNDGCDFDSFVGALFVSFGLKGCNYSYCVVESVERAFYVFWKLSWFGFGGGIL